MPFAGRDGFGYVRLKDGVQFRVGAVTKNVIFYGPGTVRVNANLGRNHWTSPSLLLVDKPGRVPFELEERAATLSIKSARLRIAIDRKTGALSFMDGAGRMAQKLLPSGYDIFTVDIQWYEPNASGYEYRKDAELTIDEYGRLLPAPNRLPSAAKGFSPAARDGMTA